LYKKTVKALRKRLGIRDARNAYKHRYGAARDLVGDTEYSWNDGFREIPLRGRGDDYDPYDDARYYDDYDPYDDSDDYDDTDYENSTELDDFVRMMNGPDPRRTRRNTRRTRKDDDYDEDDYDPYDKERDDDDIDDVYLGRYRRNRNIDQDDYIDPSDDDKYDALYHKVADLADCVQALASQSEYDHVNHRDPITHNPRPRRPLEYPNEYYEYIRKPDQPSESEIREGFVDHLAKDVADIKVATSNLIKAMQGFQDWQQGIDSLINELAYEEEEGDNVDVSFDDPVVVNNPYAETINKFPDVYETPMDELPPDENTKNPEEERDPQTMTREEVIDEINKTQPQKTNWKKDDTTEKAEESSTKNEDDTKSK
jgi:hypothetical protein